MSAEIFIRTRDLCKEENYPNIEKFKFSLYDIFRSFSNGNEDDIVDSVSTFTPIYIMETSTKMD